MPGTIHEMPKQSGGTFLVKDDFPVFKGPGFQLGNKSHYPTTCNQQGFKLFMHENENVGNHLQETY